MKKILIKLIPVSVVLFPLFAYGQRIEFQNPIKAQSIQQLITLILEIAINIGAVVAVLMFVIVGFMFIKAKGNPGELSTAKTAFLYTCIGTIVLLGAKIIQQVLENTVKQF